MADVPAPRAPLGSPGPSWAGDGGTVPPPAVTGPPGSSPPVGTVGRGGALFMRRLIAFVVDFVILVVAFTILLLVAGVDLEAVDAGDPEAIETIDRVYLVATLLQIVYRWVWNALGWSPGKRMLGLRIVTESGQAPGIWRGFARTVGMMVGALPLLLGYLWMLWDGKRQTWHDKMAGTYVVRPEQGN